MKSVKKEITDGKFEYIQSSKDLKFIELYDSDNYWDSPRVKICVCVGEDFKIQINVHGRKIPDDHSIWDSNSRYCNSVDCLQLVLKQIQKYHTCCVNQDRCLQNLIPVGTFLDVKKDYKFKEYREPFHIGNTIRATKCSLLKNNKTRLCACCEHCNTYMFCNC